MKLLIAFLPLTTLIFISCAQQKISLGGPEFVPFQSFSQVSQAQEARAPLKIEKVVDLRKESGQKMETVGEARTGARFQKTPVYLPMKAEDFVQNYLETSLGQRGFLVVHDDEEVTLEVGIKELWVEEVIEKYEPEKAKCKVALDVKGKRGEKTYTGKFWTEIVSPGDMGDATDKLNPTLASCFNVAADKMAKDKELRKFLEAQPLI